MKKLIFGFILLSIIACSTRPNLEFQLNGTTKGIEDGTVLYFDNTGTETLIDSAVVENNSFQFKTKLPKSPMQVVLRTKDYSHYRFLWLENTSMSFDATQSDFMHATVLGSSEENLSQALSKETDTLPRKERREKEQQFVMQHPNSIHSAYILSVYTTTWGKEKTKELFDNFSDANKNAEYGKSIARYIELNASPDIGENYVDFEMEDLNGKPINLSDYEGKLVLLEFWSSHCVPCREENPNLVKTYKEYQPKGFEIFAVSQDTRKEDWQKAIEKDNLPWIQVSDLKGHDNSASLIYGVSFIPDNFLIDQNGVILERNIRGEKLNAKLDELLNK